MLIGEVNWQASDDKATIFFKSVSNKALSLLCLYF